MKLTSYFERPNNLIKQKTFYIYQYKPVLQKIFCIGFSAIKVSRILVELPTIKLGDIMGNNWGHVKDNHAQKPKKLLDIAKEILRRKHYSIRTEEAYIGWTVRYIHFHNKRHPKNMGVPEIEAFLTHLAVEGNVAGSTPP